MALQKAGLPIAFAGGLETEQDPKQVPITRLLDLQNAVFTRQTTLSKRNGYAALSQDIEGGGSYAEPKALAARDRELLVFAEEHAYSYRPDADTWSDSGAAIAIIASDQPLARTGTQQTIPDVATIAGVSVVAWEDSRGGVWWAVIEAASGRILKAATQADAVGIKPRCLAVGGVLHIYYATAASQRLWVLLVNPYNPTAAIVPSILTDDLSSTNPSYDACVTTEDTTPAIMAWVSTSGWRVSYVDQSGVLGSAITGHPSAWSYVDPVAAGIAVAYSADAIGVVFADSDTGGLTWYTIDPDDLSDDTSGVLLAEVATWPRVAATWVDATLWAAAERTGATSDLSRTRVASVTAGIATDGGTIRGHGLASRAWTDNGHAYVTLAHGVFFFPYYAAVRISDDAFPVVARLLPIAATGLPEQGHLATASQDEVDARIVRVPLCYREQLSSEDDDQFGETGIRLVSLDFDHPSAYQTAQLGRGLYLAAAAPLHYDGSRWAEWGFHTAPDVGAGATIEAVPSNGAGSLTPSATYNYRIWYEEIDNQGELHQGGTSVPVVVEMGGADDTVTLQIPTYRLTSRARVRIGVARSLANDSSRFFRVTSTNPDFLAPGEINGYLLNDPTVDTVTFVDGLSDDDAGKREPLYTNGGILSNDPAPCAGAIIAGGKNRLFWTDPSDPHVVRYSQELLDGYGVECPTVLSLPVDPYGGAITGLQVLDDTVIVFKESAIYVFGGPGPRPNPTADASQYAFTPAALVTSDAGCLSQDSIGYTPIGILFQSSKGIMLLGRDRQLVRIGDPVDAYASQRVRAATLLPDRTHIVLVVDDDEGSSLLYDYKREQWSRFTNHIGVDAIVVGGAYYYLRSDGRVFAEDVDSYADDNQQIRMVIETAWVKLAGYLQGWQRIWHASFLGSYVSPHTLRVSYRMDYEAGWGQPFDLDVNENFNPSAYGEGLYGEGYYGGGVDSSTVYQRRIHIGKRCQAIRFRIEDVEVVADRGASFELSELLITGGVLGAAFKLPAARSS